MFFLKSLINFAGVFAFSQKHDGCITFKYIVKLFCFLIRSFNCLTQECILHHDQFNFLLVA